MNSFTIILCLAVFLPLALAAPKWRVINGTEPKPSEFPSIVSVWAVGQHYCGGTLVDDDTVLTAAHCFYEVRDPQRYGMFVRIGAHDLRKPARQEQQVKVVRVITHPYWRPYSFEYDFLILKLARKVQESATVKYSPLPSYQNVEPSRPGESCYVVGWGSLEKHGRSGTPVLQKGLMRVISNAECKAVGELPGKMQFRWIGPSHICTKSGYVETSACKGDSGGPLFCNVRSLNYRRVQVGVVSFGDMPCAQHNVPVAFGRISHVVNWIKFFF